MEQLSNEEVNDQVLQEVVAVVDQADESLLILFVFHTDAIELDLLLSLHLDALADCEPEFLDCIKNTNSIWRQSHRSQIDISQTVDVGVHLCGALEEIVELNRGLFGELKKQS